MQRSERIMQRKEKNKKLKKTFLIIGFLVLIFFGRFIIDAIRYSPVLVSLFINKRIDLKKADNTRVNILLLGIGGGNSALVLGTDERGAGLNASNLFLEAWLSLGLLGVLALIGMLGVLGVNLFNECRRGGEKHLLGLALLFCLLTFTLFNAGMLLGIFFGPLAYLATLTQENADTVKLATDFKVL